MENKLSREQLSNQLKALHEQSNVIRKEIDAIDHEEKISTLSKYVGKCYSLSLGKDHIHCIFIYGINEKTYNLKTLVVYDFSGGEGRLFGINQEEHYNPEKTDDYNYQEITKEKFEEHLTMIQNEINKCIIN